MRPNCKAAAVVLALVLGLSLANAAFATTSDLRVAVIGDPPTLDAQWTSAFLTQEIAWHMYEGLFTLDDKYNAVPMLVDTYEVLNLGKSYVFNLRKGVRFHNGAELQAEDVVASLNRWGRLTGYGKILYRNVAAVSAKSKYVVQIDLEKPSSIVPMLLAFPNQQAAIYPKQVIEAAGAGQIKQFVGTGPFEFVEYKPDRYIKLRKFNGYSARADKARGLAGERKALVDELNFIPVSDPMARVSGVQTGEYDYAEQIPSDLYKSLSQDPSVRTVIVKPWWWPMLVLNKKEGAMANVKVRQALLAALDPRPAMRAAFGDQAFYRIDPGLMFKEQAMWTNAGEGYYAQANIEKAKKLLGEAGYKGETIRWLTTQEYDFAYKIAVVVKEQAEKAGFKIDLQVSDWATVIDRRNKPALWEVFSGATTFTPDPGVLPHLDDSWPGWWTNPEKNALLDRMNTELDPPKRLEIWRRLETLVYTDVPFIKVGDYFLLSLQGKRPKDFQAGPFPFFWNVSLQ